MLTRRTFIASAAAPAALPFYRPETPIGHLWVERERIYSLFEVAEGDAEFNRLSVMLSAKHDEIIALAPQSARDMAIMVKVIDPDPHSCVWTPALLAHADALIGEVA